MAVVRPFRAVRPADKYAAEVAALPYDVYSREEAAEAVKGRPLPQSDWHCVQPGGGIRYW